MIAKCVECNKKFSKASNLYRHRREQHGAKQDIENEINESFCVTCNKYFKRKEHYHIHMNAIHLFKNKNVCSLCDYSTYTKSAMLRHEKKVHKNPYSGFNIRQNDPRFRCNMCTKTFTFKRALDHHQQKKHGLSTSNLRVKRNCPLCSHSVVHSSGGKANKLMYDHFFQKHGLYLDIDFLESDDLIAFYNWKASIEKTTSSKFNRSNRKAQKCFRFSCYRSGMFSSKGSGKRVLRTIGSCKINAFCPAAIIAVLKENGKVQVTFIKTHVGHSNDTWTETCKKKIQLKMKGIRNRHKASLSLGSENVFFQSDGEWQIPSKGDYYYSVRKIQTLICKNCDIKCCHCNACFHQYTCTCIDYTKKSNMCKHIHLVAKLSVDQEAVFVNEDDLLVINESCDEDLVVVDIPLDGEEEEEEGETGEVEENGEAEEVEEYGKAEEVEEFREAEEVEEYGKAAEVEEYRESEEVEEYGKAEVEEYGEAEEGEEEDLENINVYSPSDDKVDDDIEEMLVDSTAVQHFILSHVEITKQISPSPPPPSTQPPPPPSQPSQKMFIEAKKKFVEQLMTTVRDKVNNFQDLEAVQNHWKCIDSILNSSPSNSSDVGVISQQNLQNVSPTETVSDQRHSNSSVINIKKDNTHPTGTSRKEIICFKIISSSRSNERSHNFL